MDIFGRKYDMYTSTTMYKQMYETGPQRRSVAPQNCTFAAEGCCNSRKTTTSRQQWWSDGEMKISQLRSRRQDSRCVQLLEDHHFCSVHAHTHAFKTFHTGKGQRSRSLHKAGPCMYTHVHKHTKSQQAFRGGSNRTVGSAWLI